jgi:hypothetical protein
MVQRDGSTIDPGVRGESYNVDVYELVIGRAFEHVAVSARLKTDTWLRRRDRARRARTSWRWRSSLQGRADRPREGSRLGRGLSGQASSA